MSPPAMKCVPAPRITTQRILLELGGVLDQEVGHLERQGVQRLRPIERQPADAVLDLGEDVRRGHGALPAFRTSGAAGYSIRSRKNTPLRAGSLIASSASSKRTR